MGRYDSVATDKLKFCRRVGFFASDASAAIAQTSATFLRIVGSELIQKYLGDGPKLVREMFRLADEQVTHTSHTHTQVLCMPLVVVCLRFCHGLLRMMLSTCTQGMVGCR